MIPSKFSYWAVMPITISLILFLVLIVTTIVYSESLTANSNLPFLLMAFVFIFFILWLVVGELRTKAVKIIIESDRITAINFFGLGVSKTFHFSELEGFKISMVPAEYRDYEYLYLMLDKQKAIKLSEFYHENYFELKKIIAKNASILAPKSLIFGEK
jgi:hypothetical protein